MEEERLAKLLGGATLSLTVMVVCLVLGLVFRPKAESFKPQSSPASSQPVFEESSSSAPAPSAPVSQKQSAPASGTQKTYTVQAGDTLYGIAQKFEVDWKDLAEANNIEDATALRVGQELVIP